MIHALIGLGIGMTIAVTAIIVTWLAVVALLKLLEWVHGG